MCDRYISEKALIENIAKIEDLRTLSTKTIGEAISNTPTADVVEVKYGEWILLDDCANEGVYCSACRKKVYKKEYANQKMKSEFCPNCGARNGRRKEMKERF